MKQPSRVLGGTQVGVPRTGQPKRFGGTSSQLDHSKAMTRTTNANRRYTLGLGAASAGTFTLSVSNQGVVLGPSPAIQWNAVAADVNTALEAILPGVDDVLVTGTALPTGLLTIEFTGDLAGDQVTVTGAFGGLTGATPALTATQAATAVTGARHADGKQGLRVGKRQDVHS